MADLGLVAIGFGLLPLTGLLLVAAPSFLRAHETAVWGLLIGAVAFLGLAHAGATILEGNAYLKFEASPELSAATIAAGLLLGVLLGWVALGRTSETSVPASRLMWAAVAYVALHSVADGLVLGEAYAGLQPVGYPLTLATVGGTLAHRFAEGALVAVPALLAARQRPWWMGLLLVGLVSVPAAYVPVALLSPAALSATTVAVDQAVAVLVAGLEAGFAAVFLFLGLLPRVATTTDRRWAVWAGLAFTAMLLVHLLVE